MLRFFFDVSQEIELDGSAGCVCQEDGCTCCTHLPTPFSGKGCLNTSFVGQLGFELQFLFSINTEKVFIGAATTTFDYNDATCTYLIMLLCASYN